MKQERDLVICLMVTDGRPIMVEESVRMFKEQTYPNKLLLILASIDDFYDYPDDSNIIVMYYGSEYKGHLTRLRNRGAEHALTSNNAKYIAIWDDDDLQGAERLEKQINAIEETNKPMSILTSCKIYQEGKLYFIDNFFVSGSMVFDVSLLTGGKKLAASTGNGCGEMEPFMFHCMATFQAVGVHGLELYTIVYHSGNTVSDAVKKSIIAESTKLN